MPADGTAAKAIFLAALDRSTPADRTAYLAEACGGDDALRRRVEAMLRAHDAPDPLLDRPAAAFLPGTGDRIPLDFLAPPTRPGALGRLGHYEVLNVVGRGGAGVVLRAFDDKLHRVVAVKVLDPVLAGNEAARVRFVREARAAAAVTHDHVVGIHAVEDGGPVPYLVMQFVEGKTLQQKLDAAGPLPLAEVLRVGAQAAEGLAAAHRQGLVHRDVKPSNILLENGVERVKLGDFGLARAADDPRVTRSGVVAGTPAYMSPEQAAGETLDHRSDLFSLGSVLYAMCAGRPPFQADTTVAVIRQVCDEAPRPLREVNPAVPGWLAAVVARLQAKTPADRYASAAEVADVLGRRLAELQSGVTPRAETAAAPARRRPAVIGAALVVLAAGAVWAGATYWPRPQEDVKADPPAPPAPTPPAPTGPVTLKPARPLHAHAEGVRTLAFSPDGKVLASGGLDRVIYLWDTASWKQRGPLEGHEGYLSAVAFSPDGRRLASVSSAEDACRVRVWNVATAAREAELGQRTASGMWDVAYTPDGRSLVCGGWDRKLYVVDPATGAERELVAEAAPQFVRGLSVSPDGRRVVAGGSGPTRVWDVTTGEEVPTAARPPDGICPTFLPGGGVVGWNYGEGRVYLCDPSGQERGRWQSPRGKVDGLAVSADGRFVAAIGEGGMARVLSAADLTEVAVLDGHHDGTVWAVAFSPDGTRLATGGETDHTIFIWDLPAICHVRKP